MKFDDLKNKLLEFSEETSIEEARGIMAEAVELIPAVDDDITSLTNEVDSLRIDVENRDNEIEKLKTENGRLYRDRVSTIVEKDVENAENAEREYTRDELEQMFNEFK